MVQDAAETLELTAHASNGSEYLGEVEFVFRLTVTASGLRNDEGIPESIRTAGAIVVPKVAPDFTGQLTTFALQSRATDAANHEVNIASTPSVHNHIEIAQSNRNVVVNLTDTVTGGPNEGVRTGNFEVRETIDDRFEARTTNLRVLVTALAVPAPLVDGNNISADDMDLVDSAEVRANLADDIDSALYGSGVFGRVDSESQTGLAVNAAGEVRIADASGMRAGGIGTYMLKATVTSAAFLGTMTVEYHVTVTQTNIRNDEGIPAAIRTQGQFQFAAWQGFTGTVTSFILGGDRVNIGVLPDTDDNVRMSQSGRTVIFEQTSGLNSSTQRSRFNNLNERINANFHPRAVDLTIDIRRMNRARRNEDLTIPPTSVDLPVNNNLYDFKTHDAALAAASGFAELAGSGSAELDVSDAGVVSSNQDLASGNYGITVTVSHDGAFLGVATLSLSLTVRQGGVMSSERINSDRTTSDRLTRVVIPGYSGSVVAYAAGHAEVTLHSPASAPAGFNVDTNAQRTNQAPLVVSMQAALNSGTRSATMTITATRSGRRLTPIELTLTVTAVGPPTQTDPDVIGTNQEVSGDISFTEPTDTIGGINVGGGTFANLRVTRIDTGADTNSLALANGGVVGGGGGVSGAINQPGEYRLEVDYTDPDLIGTLPLTLTVTVQNIFVLNAQNALTPAPSGVVELYAPIGHQGDIYTLTAAAEVLIDGRDVSPGGSGFTIDNPPSSGVGTVTIRAGTNSAFRSTGGRREVIVDLDFICNPASSRVCQPDGDDDIAVLTVGANPVAAPDQPTFTVGVGQSARRQAFVRPTESASFATGGDLQTIMHDPDDVDVGVLGNEIVVRAITAGEHDIEIGFTHPDMLGTLVVEMTIEALATMAVFYNKALYSPALPITVDDADHQISPSSNRDAIVQYLGVRRGLTMALVSGDGGDLFDAALASGQLSRFDNLLSFCSDGGSGWRMPNLAEVAGMLDDDSGTTGGFTRRTSQNHIPGAQNSGSPSSNVYALTYGDSFGSSDASLPDIAAGLIADLSFESGGTRARRLVIGRASTSGGRPTFGGGTADTRMICVKPEDGYTKPADPAGVRVTVGADDFWWKAATGC